MGKGEEIVWGHFAIGLRNFPSEAFSFRVIVSGKYKLARVSRANEGYVNDSASSGERSRRVPRLLPLRMRAEGPVRQVLLQHQVEFYCHHVPPVVESEEFRSFAAFTAGSTAPGRAASSSTSGSW